MWQSMALANCNAALAEWKHSLSQTVKQPVRSPKETQTVTSLLTPGSWRYSTQGEYGGVCVRLSHDERRFTATDVERSGASVLKNILRGTSRQLFIYCLGCNLSILLFNSSNPVLLYASVLPALRWPANSWTTLRSLFSLSKCAITDCLIFMGRYTS